MTDGRTPAARAASAARPDVKGDAGTGKGTSPRRRPSLDAVAFDLVLLVFLGALLVSLPPSGPARLVPMLIVVPTLLGVAYQLWVDLTPSRHAGEAAEEVSPPPEVRRRQVLFVAWLLGFFVLAWLTSFLIVLPVALFVIFRFVNNEGLLVSVALALGMWAFIYVLFGVLLAVRF